MVVTTVYRYASTEKWKAIYYQCVVLRRQGCNNGEDEFALCCERVVRESAFSEAKESPIRAWQKVRLSPINLAPVRPRGNIFLHRRKEAFLFIFLWNKTHRQPWNSLSLVITCVTFNIGIRERERESERRKKKEKRKKKKRKKYIHYILSAVFTNDWLEPTS